MIFNMANERVVIFKTTNQTAVIYFEKQKI